MLPPEEGQPPNHGAGQITLILPLLSGKIHGTDG